MHVTDVDERISGGDEEDRDESFHFSGEDAAVSVRIARDEAESDCQDTTEDNDTDLCDSTPVDGNSIEPETQHLSASPDQGDSCHINPLVYHR